VEVWKPFPGPQETFCSRGEFEVLFGGAKSPGKTDCLIADATHGISHPRYRAAILRRTYPRLQEIIDRCHEIYPRLGGEYHTQEHRWWFPGGAKILLGQCQHEESKRDYHGKEFHYIGFDELTEFSDTQYLFILANIRCSVPGLRLLIRATTNPGGIGHVWVKKRFVDACMSPGKTTYVDANGDTREMAIPGVYLDPVTQESRCFVPATVYDNARIMKHDPGYVRRLEGLPELERKRFLLGLWEVFEGQSFPELSQQTHGCEPFQIPDSWEKFMVFDWGYSRPWAALWFAVDYDGVVYLYRAWYGMLKDSNGEYDPNKGARQTNTEICRVIIEQEKERLAYRVADPAVWGPTKVKGSNTVLGPSFIEDASKEGLYFLRADNDRARGKAQVHMRLKVEQHEDEEGNVELEPPRFVIFNSDENGERGVKRYWDEMQALVDSERNVEDVDTDQPDEGYDCTRYAFMSRPLTPKPIKRIPPGSFAAERDRLIRARKYARRHGVSLSAAYSRTV
jgi:hypothetical protein